MEYKSGSAALILSVVALVCLGSLAGCGASTDEPLAEATSIAGTVIAQITATAESLTLPTKIAATVIAQLTAEAPTATATSVPTITASPSPRPTASRTPTHGPTSTPRPTNTPRPTPTLVYGTLGNPVPFGTTVTRRDATSIFLPQEVSITVLDVIRGTNATALINRVATGQWHETPASGDECVAVKLRLEIPSAPAHEHLSLEAYFHLGYWYPNDNHPYSLNVTPSPFVDGYSPVAGEGWAYFITRKGEALPLLYFRHDLWWGMDLLRLADQKGTFFSLERGNASTQSAEAPGTLPSGPSATANSKANLRAGPGTSYPILGQMSQGNALSIVGRDAAIPEWWLVAMPNGQEGWVSAQLVDIRNADGVPVVAVPKTVVAVPAPTAQVSQPAASWVLVADSAADFPGGPSHNHWYYLWTDGRNNFNWQPMALDNPGNCYQDPNGWGLSICADSIMADSRGDVGLQWKASQGGTYRFEWDSPSLRFYKHATLAGSQGKGRELPFSATIDGVIDWEMFFWVADANTPYHVRTFRLEQ